MAKKRGGIAGFYDRNKKVIKPVAAGLAGMLGTPALGAAVGAAFGGLDREGKRGIGVDLGGAAKGGLSGYAAGSAGSALGKMAGIGKIGGLESAGNRISGLFTGGGNAASTSAVSPLDKLTGAPQVGLTPSVPNITDIGSKYVTPMNQPLSMMPQTMMGAPTSYLPKEPLETGGLRKMASDAFAKGGYLERNQGMIGGVAKGVGSVLGGRAEGQAMADQTELARQKFEYEKEQQMDEQERRRRMAELLMPLFTQMQSRQSYGG
jgi:hypothetical protein